MSRSNSCFLSSTLSFDFSIYCFFNLSPSFVLLSNLYWIGPSSLKWFSDMGVIWKVREIPMCSPYLISRGSKIRSRNASQLVSKIVYWNKETHGRLVGFWPCSSITTLVAHASHSKLLLGYGFWLVTHAWYKSSPVWFCLWAIVIFFSLDIR